MERRGEKGRTAGRNGCCLDDGLAIEVVAMMREMTGSGRCGNVSYREDELDVMEGVHCDDPMQQMCAEEELSCMHCMRNSEMTGSGNVS
jgi:hypothetical protein